MQNETAKENLLRQIREYRPYNEQEERDRAILLKWMESGCDILTRENERNDSEGDGMVQVMER